MNTPARLVPDRVDWVDYGKGFCIVMVVMMHSTLGVEQVAGQTGYMHALVAFAKPFRMPDFFLISGLFLAQVINRDWKTYLDRKVVHFAYFYVLWMTIQFAFKAPSFGAEHGWLGALGFYLVSFIDPFGTLWFIYLLPLFFVTAKLARQFHVPPLVLWLVAAGLHVMPIATEWTVLGEFPERFVFFCTGYLMAPRIFALAALVQRRWQWSLAGLAAWALFNGTLVVAGVSDNPFVSLGLGLIGAVAVVSMSALLAKLHWLGWLRFCGQNSIVVYLSFFLPMAISRTLLMTLDVIDIGTVSLLVTACGVAGSLAMWWVARRLHLGFLYVRPARFCIAERRRVVLQPAE